MFHIAAHKCELQIVGAVSNRFELTTATTMSPGLNDNQQQCKELPPSANGNDTASGKQLKRNVAVYVSLSLSLFLSV